MNAPPSAIRPRALIPETRVALVAPAGPVDAERVAAAREHCRALGLEPVLLPSATARVGYLAGTDAERLADLQAAFDDPEIGAVWALRGGYGTLRILDRLSLERQRSDPIPFIGFSDNTTLHARHAAMGVVSFHGPHPGQALTPEADAWFRRVLFEPRPAGPLPRGGDGRPPRCLSRGVAEGRLVGGSLAMLASLCGSRDAPRAAGAILFLEDVGEAPYRVDRMLVQLRRSGVLDGVVGLAFGRFTEPREGDVADVAHVLAEFAAEVGVPAVADLPFGHVDANCVLPVGVLARLDAATADLTVLEAAVREA